MKIETLGAKRQPSFVVSLLIRSLSLRTQPLIKCVGEQAPRKYASDPRRAQGRAGRDVGSAGRKEEAINYRDPGEFDLRVSRAFLSRGTTSATPSRRRRVFVAVVSPSHRLSPSSPSQPPASPFASRWMKTVLLSEIDVKFRAKVSDLRITDSININTVH